MVFLVLGLLITFSFFSKELKRHEQNQKAYYRDQIDHIRQNIEFRLQTYVDEQISGAAFIAASKEVTRVEWRQFVAALKLDINYPGINGLGFAIPVKKEDSLAFVRKIQRENMPWFGITNLGKAPNATEYFVVKYIEPQYRNREALGLDMGSEPHRRDAMEKSRQTGLPFVSKKVTLVQDQGKTPGFLIFVPVYKSDSDSDSARQQFKGWSYAPFIAKNFMNRLLPFALNQENRPFEIELFDGSTPDFNQILYKTWEKQPVNAKDYYKVTFPVYGHKWTLRILPAVNPEWSKDQKTAYLILIGGILLSVLLYFLMKTLANTRRNAIVLAEKMTSELRTLNQNLDKKVEERTLELEAKNRQLSQYAENLKNSYEDLEVKVKFRNLQLEKQVKALQEENLKLKNPKG